MRIQRTGDDLKTEAGPGVQSGAAWVSNLSAEPVVFREVLDDLVRPPRSRGLLRLPDASSTAGSGDEGDRVSAIVFENLESGEQLTITSGYILDATEEGDVLPLTGCESVVGAESAGSTGEPHALDGPADPWDQQAITWCAALEWRPGGPHDRPEGYEFWQNYRADFWPGPPAGLVDSGTRDGQALEPSAVLRVR